MNRISASSYSNTAPLIWSFLFGSMHGSAEVILDNAPSRSAALLAEGRVDAALVPVIAFQYIADAKLIGDACVGAKERVRSVCLVTRGEELEDVTSVALDVSSKTSVALTKIVFREFLSREPDWIDFEPSVDNMLDKCGCALLIGDPALSLAEDPSKYRTFDLAEIWKRNTGLGFVFAMWMTRKNFCGIDFGKARDEGLTHLDDIVSNYLKDIPLSRNTFIKYLSENISYTVDASMAEGLEMYFDLCRKHGLIESARAPVFV
jgi:chorismate dehydratase